MTGNKQRKRKMPEIPDELAANILKMATLREDVTPDESSKNFKENSTLEDLNVSKKKSNLRVKNESKALSFMGTIGIQIEPKNVEQFQGLISKSLNEIETNYIGNRPDYGDRKIMVVRLPWEIYQMFLVQINMIKQKVKSYSTQTHILKLILKDMADFFSDEDLIS